MQTLRALIRKHRHLAMALLLIAFCIKGIMPAGFMVSPSSNTILTVSICSDGFSAPKQMKLVIPRENRSGSHADEAKKGDHCAFSGLAKVGVGGSDIILLALAFAFILLLGLSPIRRLPFRQISNLRPPLRGPPAFA